MRSLINYSFLRPPRSSHARRDPLLQRYDAPQPSCRRHPNSTCGRPNAQQWHSAEAIYADIATAKKINRKSPITCLAINWQLNASPMIELGRWKHARTPSLISGMIRIARLRFFIFCVKTLNGRFRFHIELDLPLQEDTPR